MQCLFLLWIENAVGRSYRPPSQVAGHAHPPCGGGVGSMAKAADRLPSRNRCVAINRRFGTYPRWRLLDRSRRGMSPPSTAGRSSLMASRPQRAQARGQGDRVPGRPHGGELRIGTADPDAGLVCTVIDRLSRKISAPHLSCETWPAPPICKIASCAARDIDLIVGRLPTPIRRTTSRPRYYFHARLAWWPQERVHGAAAARWRWRNLSMNLGRCRLRKAFLAP